MPKIDTNELGVTPDDLASGNFPTTSAPDKLTRVEWMLTQLDYYRVDHDPTGIEAMIVTYRCLRNIFFNVLSESSISDPLRKELGSKRTKMDGLMAQFNRNLNQSRAAQSSYFQASPIVILPEGFRQALEEFELALRRAVSLMR